MMKKLEGVSFILITISGILWGIYALWELDMVNYLLGPNWLADLVDVLFGIAAVVFVLNFKSLSRKI